MVVQHGVVGSAGSLVEAESLLELADRRLVDSFAVIGTAFNVYLRDRWDVAREHLKKSEPHHNPTSIHNTMPRTEVTTNLLQNRDRTLPESLSESNTHARDPQLKKDGKRYYSQPTNQQSIYPIP